MELLDQIRDYANQAHGNQKRKYSQQPYIVHPVAVMNLCREYTDDTAILAAALLHDVLEDTEVTTHDLRAYLLSVVDKKVAEDTVRLVKDLTDEFTKDRYPHLSRKKRRRHEAERLQKAAPKAQTVKYADLIDNCVDIVKHDRDFGKVFIQEAELLLSHMTEGDAQLRQRALKTVWDCRQILDLD